MSSGGARNRSGPQPDPHSLKSARIGLSLTALPAEGFTDEPPAFPLPRETERELELWRWAWSTPQAHAWMAEPWRWHAVAMWVRTSALCESCDATAADKNSLHRFADQIGLTPAGLKENGWKIEAAGARREQESGAPKSSSRARLKVVSDGVA